jgi:predicted kinase
MMASVLVIVSGLPGAGKSALADALGHELPAPVLSVDPIEAAIWRCGITPSFETGVAAYEIAATLATHQMQLGLTVVVDAVSSLEVAREMWRGAAARAEATTRVIEVVCSDETTHRARLAGRVRGIDGFPEPSWDDVIARRDEWEPWREPRLLIDSTRRHADNLAEALSYVSR